MENLILPLWCADVHVSVLSMIWDNLFSTELSPLTEELLYFPYRQGSEHRLQSKRHKPLLIVLSHRFHSAAAFVPGMAEDQELTQAHQAALEAPVQRSSSTYRSAEHSQALLSGLLSLRDSSILFDVVLVVEDKPIEAHRILLAASCDYFRYTQ